MVYNGRVPVRVFFCSSIDFRSDIMNSFAYSQSELTLSIITKGDAMFWYGVMNLVQMNILEAYAIL